MVFYISIYLISLLLFFVTTKSEKSHKKIIILISALFLAFFAGLRYGIGTDYFYTYKPEYDTIVKNQTGYWTNFDIGVYIIFWICAKTALGFHFALFLTSLITFSAFFFGMYRFSKDNNRMFFVGCSLIVLFYYQISYNILRQVLAIAVLFYAVSFDLTTANKKAKHYIIEILLALVAISFHKTSLIFIVFYLFRNLFSQKKYWIIQIAVIALAFFFTLRNEILKPVLDLLHLSKYASYLKNVSLHVTIGYLIRLVPMLITVFFLRKTIFENKILYFCIFAFILGYILRLLAYNDDAKAAEYIPAAAAAERISLCFTSMQAYIYSVFLSKKYPHKFIKFLQVSVVIILVGLWYYEFGILNLHETVPYKFYFLGGK